MKKLLLIIALYFCCFVSINAQFSDVSGYLMKNTFQSTHSNPAAIPYYKFSLGLPIISGVRMSAGLSGFTGSEIFNAPATNDAYVIDMKKLSSNINGDPYVYLNGGIELLHAHIKVKNSFVMLFVKDNLNFSYGLPKDLFVLLSDGNAAFQNKKADLSSFSPQMNYYREIGIGYQHMRKKFDFGIRLKYLSGIFDLSSNIKSANISTSQQNYALLIDANGEINTSVPQISNGSVSQLVDAAIGFKNHGAGIDLGFTYKLNDKFHFNVAVNNLGFISYTNNTNKTTFSANAGYNGSDVLNAYLSGNSSAFVNLAPNIDSLLRRFSGKSESSTGYVKMIQPNAFISARYNVCTNFNLTGVLALDYFNAKVIPSPTFGINYDFRKWFGINASITYRFGKYIQPGIGLMFKPGPFQIYLSTDNIFSGFAAAGMIPVEQVMSFNNTAKLGINLIFGNNKLSDKHSY